MSKKFVDQASNAFMTITVSISRWSGVAQLKHGAAVAAADAGANSEAARLYVNVLGHHHSDLKRVNGLYAAIRTYLYDNTLPMAQDDSGLQKRGDRLIPVCRVPEVITELGKLKAAADQALDDFLPEYDRLVQIAQSVDLGNWSSEVRHPDVDDVRAKFACRISPPKPIPSMDMERFASLPASLAAEIADANNSQLEIQLQGAKQAAMTQAKEQMATLVKVLDTSTIRISAKTGNPIQPRLHESLISNTKRVGRMLRDMTEGYDNDPRLLALADLIDEKIGNVKTTETWQTFPSRRKASLKAARTVHKGLGDLTQAGPAPAQPTTSNLSAESVIDGGMLADLL